MFSIWYLISSFLIFSIKADLTFESTIVQSNEQDVLNQETVTVEKYPSGHILDEVAAVQFLKAHDKAASLECNKLVQAEWNYATNITEENKNILVSF